MSTAPVEPHALVPCQLLDEFDLRRQVALDLGHVAADRGVDLQVALEELRFHRAVQLRRQTLEDRRDAAAQGQRLRVHEVELDLDPERRPGTGDERVGGHDRLLLTDSESSTTLCARTLAPMTRACSSMSKWGEWRK